MHSNDAAPAATRAAQTPEAVAPRLWGSASQEPTREPAPWLDLITGSNYGHGMLRAVVALPVRMHRISREAIKAALLGRSARDKAALGVDMLRYHQLRLRAFTAMNTVRHVTLRDGRSLTYRINRGDLQSIREVLLDEVYRLPFETRTFDVVIDLGANIGLTSLFYQHTLRPQKIIAVEPDPSNAALARRNLAAYDHIEVIEAAIGSVDSLGHFEPNCESNLGRLDPLHGSLEVRVMSMATILERVAPHSRILVKLDIEGGEGELLGRNTGWLSSVAAIIAELHPQLINVETAAKAITGSGMRYVPAGTAWPGSMDAFERV